LRASFQRWDARAGCLLARPPTPSIPLRLLGGAGPEAALLAGAQALRAHEPGDTILAAAFAGLAQIGEHTRAAIGAAAARKALGDQGRELRIAATAWALRFVPVRVEAAFADLERLGQRAHRVVGVELFHHREALWGISAEQMPKAFFRMSLCWRR